VPLLDAFLTEGVRVNFWLAARADGLGGSGSQADPFNAGLQKFDGVMVKIWALTEAQLSPITVYLGPGIYETKGYRTDNETSPSGWQPKAGMKILGSGIEVATIKLTNATVADAHYCAIGHSLGVSAQADYCEIAEFTIDCNMPSSPNVACGAIRLMGSHTRLRRVRACNWGTRSTSRKCFVFSVITATSGVGGIQTVDAGIEECLANAPAEDGGASRVTAFHAGGKEDAAQVAEAFGTGPFIRNCFVDAGVPTPSKTGKYYGLSMGWCRLGIIEGNQVHNLDVGGPYQDIATTRDIVVRDSFFRNVARGPYWNLGNLSSNIGVGTPPPSTNLSRTGGRADITVVAGQGLAAADRVKVGTSPAVSNFDGMRMLNGVGETTISYGCDASGVTSATVALLNKVFGVGKLLVEDNYFELTPGTSPVAIELNDNGAGVAPDYVHGDIIIRGNRIRYVDGITPITISDVFIAVNGAKNVIIGSNVFESTNLNPIQTARCGKVTSYNNLDPVRFATEAEDALLMALFNRKAR